MSIFDAIHDFFFGKGDDDDGDDLFGNPDEEPFFSGLDIDGEDLGGMSEILDYLTDNPNGEEVNATFGTLAEAVEYAQAAPIGVLQIVIEENEIAVWRSDDSK